MLRQRLLLNLLPFVVILLATGIYAIVLFSRLARTFDTTVAEQYRSLIAVQQMNLALTGLDRELWAATALGNAKSRQAATASQRLFEENLALQLRNASQPADRALNRALLAKYEEIRQAARELASLSQPEQRRSVDEQRITPALLEVKTLLGKMLESNQTAILATGKSVRQITRDVTRLMIIGMGIALVLTAYASYQLGRWVLRPIQRVTKATRDVAEGNLDLAVPVVSRDELGELALAFNKMAARLQEYRQSTTGEIVRLHRTMETTLASFPDPIFVLSNAGAIELKNPAAEELAAGLGSADRLPDRLHELARQALATGRNFLPHSFTEVMSYRVNGAEKFFLPRILTMRDKADVLFGVAVVLYDVTRFRLLDAAKTHLVGTVSHELKTPLTSVRMALHILLEKSVGMLTSKQEELLQAARNDAERLLNILNNLLDLARLEQGGVELHREPVAPADLLQSALEEASDRVTARGLRIDCALDPGLPLVSVDRQRISHVFANLLTNAIKHSPVGGQIRLGATKSDDHTVRFSVSDDGPGIAPEYHARIFDRFFRVPGQGKGGAGLGLSIAREIAVAHGGRIGVRSLPGQGATFYLDLNAGTEA